MTASMICRGAFDDLDTCNYELMEAEFRAKEEEYSWVDRLTSILEATLTWIQPSFTQTNFDTLVTVLLGKVS